MEVAEPDLPRSGKQRQVTIDAALCTSDEYSPLVDGSEKNDVTEPCSGSGIDIVDCHHSKVALFIEEAGGLDMRSKPLLISGDALPDFIPVIPKEMFSQPSSTIDAAVVGVTFKDILTKPLRKVAGSYQVPPNIDIDTAILRLPVFKGKLVVLFTGGRDVLIEHMWHSRDSLSLFDKIASMGFYCVTGMNFSLIIGECPLGQAINLNKSLVFCQELDRRGVRTIPNIYAVNDAQRQRWSDYLNSSAAISQVNMNEQLQRNKISIANDDTNIRWLLGNTTVNVILQGRRRPLPSDLRGNPRLQIASSGDLKRQALTERQRLYKLVGQEDLENSSPSPTSKAALA